MWYHSFEELLLQHAAEFPDRCALRFPSGGHCSYRELTQSVQQEAERRRASGKTCLGVLCDGSFACVRAILSAVAAGMQVVLLDENLPDDKLPELIRYTDIDELWGEDALGFDAAPYLTEGVRDGRGRLLFFTSGTTDASKAVVLTEQSLCASAWNGNEVLPLHGDDTLLCLLPLNHVFGFVCGLLWGLHAGATVSLGDGPRGYLTAFSVYHPTVVSLVPALFGFLLQKQAFNPELRQVLIGAGGCPPALLEAGKRCGFRVSVGYGLTETSSGVALSVDGNPDEMTVCPDDEIMIAYDREILISAPTCMMQGYYKRPADTDAVLTHGILHTGDLGALNAAGQLRVTGRKKEMLVLPDGTKIFLPEYEAEIAAALGTAELAVALRDDKPVLILAGSEEPKQVLLQKLADVQAKRPRGQQLTDIIILGDPLPRTATGKLRRWAIARRLERL